MYLLAIVLQPVLGNNLFSTNIFRKTIETIVGEVWKHNKVLEVLILILRIKKGIMKILRGVETEGI
jgi:hypothetical protein